MALATDPTWTLPAHVDLIDQLLVRVAAGELRRLIVTVPVRHGKSEMCSRYFPAWLLGMQPRLQVVVAGYAASFAEEWGAKARDVLEMYGKQFFGVSLRSSSKAKAHWNIEQMPGGMFALGVGGQLTGRGADVLVIDDPFKNAEEADSEVMRDKLWDWYWSTARTRLEPKGAVVILMARWHEDDLVGRLLNHPTDIEPWTVVNLPALAEADDPLGRQEGEALWPERYDQAELEAIRISQPPRWWWALYQQKPTPGEGLLFKRQDFRRFQIQEETISSSHYRWYVLADEPGLYTRRIDTGYCTHFQTVDVAISAKQTADYTVVATWARTPQGDLILLDCQRQHYEEQQTVDFLQRTNDEHGRPPMWVERFGAGRSPLAILGRNGYPVMELPVEAGTKLDKNTRAFGAIALYQQHKVFHPSNQPAWLGDFENELCVFDKGAHDDMVDVTAYAARLLPIISGREPAPARERDPSERPISAGVRSMAF